MPVLTAAIIAMLIQQSLMTMSTSAIPALWKFIGPEFGLGDAKIAIYSLAVYSVGFFASSAAGSAILRFGPLRSSQICLISAAWAMLAASFGQLWLFLPAAFLLGFGLGPSTPASSQILARFATPQQAPLVFSIKQTGVPVGGFLAGFVLVPLADAAGWQIALLLAGIAAWSAAIWMQRFRTRFDDQRSPTRRLSFADVGISFRAATSSPALRKLAFAGFAFSGLQVTFMYYFIVYAVSDIGLDRVVAGQVYGVASLVAIAGRIGWGWLAGRVFSSRALLIVMSVAMFATAAAIGMATPRLGRLWAWRGGAGVRRDRRFLEWRASRRGLAPCAPGPGRGRHGRRDFLLRAWLAGPASALWRGLRGAWAFGPRLRRHRGAQLALRHPVPAAGPP